MAGPIWESNLELRDSAGLSALDDLESLDSRPVQPLLDLLGRFDQQLHEAVRLGGESSLPSPPADIAQVIFCGLGGSAIGGDLLAAYLSDTLLVPFWVHRDYSLPAWVSERSLVFVCSYSGDTRETVSALELAHQRGAPVVCLSSGGKVSRLARQWRLPWICLPEGFPPRMAVLYGMVPPLVLLERLGLCSEQSRSAEDSAEFAAAFCRRCRPETGSRDNPAKQLAALLAERLPVVTGSAGRLEVLARRWAGQLCENAKQLAFFNASPEMAHNELVGWLEGGYWEQFPLTPVFLRDRGDHPDLQRQMHWIAERAGSVGYGWVRVWTRGESWLERLWSLLLLGDYTSLYGAWLRRRDPLPIQSIEALKRALEASAPHLGGTATPEP